MGMIEFGIVEILNMNGIRRKNNLFYMETKKDISRIPNGLYCYTWKELPTSDNNFKGKINRCPYFEDKNIEDYIN